MACLMTPVDPEAERRSGGGRRNKAGAVQQGPTFWSGWSAISPVTAFTNGVVASLFAMIFVMILSHVFKWGNSRHRRPRGALKRWLKKARGCLVASARCRLRSWCKPADEDGDGDGDGGAIDPDEAATAEWKRTGEVPAGYIVTHGLTWRGQLFCMVGCLICPCLHLLILSALREKRLVRDRLSTIYKKVDQRAVRGVGARCERLLAEHLLLAHVLKKV